jgi:hypothetical protein
MKTPKVLAEKIPTLLVVPVVVALTVLLAGCGERLRITVDPPDAVVTLIRQSDGRMTTVYPPRDLPIHFRSTTDRYTVLVEPNPLHDEGYAEYERTITESEFVNLPFDVGRSHVRVLSVTLPRREYVQIDYVYVFVDELGMLRSVLLPSRSYREITEIDGAAPAVVRDLGLNLGIEGMSISPDGSRIVYSEAIIREQPREMENIRDQAGLREVDLIRANLRGIRLAGGGIERITDDDYKDRFPSFSNDGRHLLFSSDRRRHGSQDLLLISATARGGISDVYVDYRGASLSMPTQAEIGTIAFGVDIGGDIAVAQRHQIWTIGGPRELPTQVGLGTDPRISPDGSTIAYIGSDGNLYVLDLESAIATQLTFRASEITTRYLEGLSESERVIHEELRKRGGRSIRPYSYPSWSPDGRYLLYSAMESNDSTGRPKEDIYILAMDGSRRPQQLTTNGSADRYPLMSPDMRNIYFMSNRGERWAIWRIPAPSLN